MAKNLVIVESPAKAKTIEGFLGKDYKVESSFGHIRDLSSKNMGVDVENDFNPDYEIPSDKKDVVSRLKKEVKSSEVVWLATDEDREGEAIAWHLYEALKLDNKETRRIVFHEITKTAIHKAVDNPREIDYHLVDAQQARRILDRLVGFELSPVLWRKVKQGLSAGRVQSVAVRLIVERERAIQAFTADSSYRVVAEFSNAEEKLFKAELPQRFSNKEEAQLFLEQSSKSIFTVNKVEKRPGKKTPAAPFTTSTLQQEAARKLGFSVGQTMSVAQKLYEAGKISYMRTDSVNLSDEAMSAAKGEIEKLYGPDFSNPKRYQNKNKGAQEAHEAIRPTYMGEHEAGSDRSEQRLYDLIWKRTIASQMSDAQIERTTVTIAVSEANANLQAKGEVIVFEGFLKAYLEGTDEDDQEEQKGMLPRLHEGENLLLKNMDATERFTRHPARFTEASLVKKLEELGIGRPSTYAPTISTVQRRGYVEKEEKEGKERKYTQLYIDQTEVKEQVLTETVGAEKNKLTPTDTGVVVNDFLVSHFDQILDYHFTASVEEEFDQIAMGDKEWKAMLGAFYKNFHHTVEDVKEHAERAVGERLLGVDEKTGKNIYVRLGRFGPMVQLGETSDEEEKPKFASLRKGQSIESISLEEALELFKLPRKLGEYEDKVVTAAIGRFGPYLSHNKKFVSLKVDDPLEVSLERAIELIEEKRQADLDKIINIYDEEEPVIEVLKGRWGPYITSEKLNYKIPKDIDAASLSREDCLKVMKENPPKKKGGAKRRAKKS